MAEDELQNLWNDLNPNPTRISAEEVRKYVEALRRQTRKRHLIGWVAGTLVVLGYLATSFLIPNLWFRAGALLMIIWAGFSFRHIWVGRSRILPGDMETKGLVDLYRGELMRQKELYSPRRFAIRFLLLLPGPPLVFWGFAQAYPEFAWLEQLNAVAFAVACVVAYLVNRQRQRKFQRQIEQLDASCTN